MFHIDQFKPTVIDADTAPTIRLARALTSGESEQASAIGVMLREVSNSPNYVAAIASVSAEFAAEYQQCQGAAGDTKSGKQVRASRTSDLRAVLKAGATMPDQFMPQAQQFIDNGKAGLQALAKLARQLMSDAKPSAESSESESESDGEEDPATGAESLLAMINAAIVAANELGRDDVASLLTEAARAV